MARKSKKWIQAARESMKRRGTVGSYGHHSPAQMKRDIRAGGKRGKKARFALNMRRIAARGRGRGGHRRS